MGTMIHVELREGRRAVLPLVAAVFAVGGALVGWLHLDRLSVPICIFKAMTGLPCMTCGTTRALARLTWLEPWAAFQVNPLASIVLSALLALGLVDFVLWTQGRRLKIALSSGQKAWGLGLGLAALFVNWAYLIWARV